MRRFAPLLLAICLPLIAACAQKAEAPEGTVAPTPTFVRPSASPFHTPFPLTPTQTPFIPRPPDLTIATVTRVVDGDTIEVDIVGQTYTLRYIGIDTPETVDPNRPVGCYGQEASDRNRELVLNQTVGLEKDVSETDAYDRLLRYIWLGDQMVNALLVRDGYAIAKAYPPDTKHQFAFDSLQVEAQSAQRGLWGATCANATPVATHTQTPPSGSGNETCDFSGTNQSVIKGNISSSGEKIYHVPGQNSYDETGITESRGERWFCTEPDAVAAGWRKSKS